MLMLEGEADSWKILTKPENEYESSTNGISTSSEPLVPLDLKPELFVSVIDHNFEKEDFGFDLKHSQNYERKIETLSIQSTYENAYVHSTWRVHVFDALLRYKRGMIARFNNLNVSQELNNMPVGSLFRYRNCGLCAWNNGTTLNWFLQPNTYDVYVKRNIRRIRVGVYHYGPTPSGEQTLLTPTYILVGNTNFFMG